MNRPEAPSPARSGEPASRHAWAFTAVSATAIVAALYENLHGLALVNVLADEKTYAHVGWRLVHWSSLRLDAQTMGNGNFEHPPFGKVVMGAAELIAGHESILAARYLAVSAGLLTALVAGLWIGRVRGCWAGLATAAAIALVPLSVSPQETRFSRDAMLDMVAMPLAVTAVSLAWGWVRTRGLRSWVLAAGAGVSAGLATASRETAFLCLVAPAVVAVCWSMGSWSLLGTRLLQAVVASATAVGVFVATYLPFGSPLARIRYLWDFQSRQSHVGHRVGLDGIVTDHPPWWADLWFASQGIGGVVSLLVVIGMVCAVGVMVLRRDRLVLWLVTALIGPFVFHSFVAGVTLPFYWALWAPLAITVAVVGFAEVWPRPVSGPSRWHRPARALRRVAVGAAVVTLSVPVGQQLSLVARLQPSALSRLAAERAAAGLQGVILTSGTYNAELYPYTGTATVVTSPPRDPATVDTVIVGQPRCRFSVSAEVRAFVAVNRARGSLLEVGVDRLDVVYLARAPQVDPTPAQVAAQPWVPPNRYC